MESGLKKKYGLFTAISMVVGIVIGSGVFFKAEKILAETNGNLIAGIYSWIIGGLIMTSCAYVFGVMASKYEKINGIVDYAEATLGKKYGYFFGWFMATIYYPTLTSVLAWVSARYFAVLAGWDITGGECMTIAALFLIVSYAVNTIAPKIAGYFQVTTTIIKLIPLIFIVIFGIISGAVSGTMSANFQYASSAPFSSTSLFSGVVAAAFAYDGWIIATCINSELKDAKRTLPLALIFGSLFVMATYVLYYVGISSSLTTEEIMTAKEGSAILAFTKIFGNAGGRIILTFITISCLGTLNGLMLGCVRGFYSIAARKEGPKHEMLRSVDEMTQMPQNSGIMGLLMCMLWLTFFYGANLSTGWFAPFNFDSSELPIVTIYAMYIPILIAFMVKEKEFGIFKRFIMPTVAILASIFMVVASIYAHKLSVVYYLIVYAVIMALGVFLEYKNKSSKQE